MRSKMSGSGKAYLFLLPNLFGTVCFVLIPFLDVFRRSCLQAVGSGFVGLSNYRAVLENKAFRLAAANTARFMAVCIPLLLLLSLWVAVMFQSMADAGCRKRRGKTSGAWGGRRKNGILAISRIKTGFTLPMAIPAASVVVFFRMLFDEKGWLNLLAGWLGFLGRDWLNGGCAFWVLVVCYIWKNLGYDMILWMTGIAGIEKEQYEAARVQGAGGFACFWYITLPQLRATAYVTALLSFVNGFRVFREAYLLSGDYPHESIYMLQHLFNNWFVNLDIQKLTAAASLLVLATGIFLFAAGTLARVLAPENRGKRRRVSTSEHKGKPLHFFVDSGESLPVSAPEYKGKLHKAEELAGHGEKPADTGKRKRRKGRKDS